MRPVGDGLDLVSSLVIIVAFLPFYINSCIHFVKSDFGGFDTQLEKTAMDTHGEIADVEEHILVEDVLMSIAVADEFEPEPKQFNINGIKIKIDDEFFNNRLKNVRRAQGAFSDWNKEKQIKVVAGEDKLSEWKVVNK